MRASFSDHIARTGNQPCAARERSSADDLRREQDLAIEKSPENQF
jgi:hypothetical protein